MKILRIINRFNLGGPTYNAGYLTKLMGEDCETRLIGGSPLPEEAHSGFILDKIGVQYEELHEMSRAVNPFQDFRAFLRIRKIIREFKPDIVHTHAAKAGVLGRLAARLEGVPVVIHTYHGHVFSGYFGKRKSNIIKAIERWLAKRSDAIITISKAQFEDIVHVHRICAHNKAHVIPLGFDLSRFTIDQEKKRTHFRERFGIAPDIIAVGIVGRFAPVKNHQLFFETIKILMERGVSFKAIVIGDGSDAVHWKNWVQTHLKDRAGDVVFTSWIQEMDEAMAALDIVVLTSLNEGTPVSLIEAQAASRLVVSTPAGGVRDCMLDGESGIISKTFEATEFADTLQPLILSPEIQKRMGESGKQFVMERFSHLRLVSDVRILYDALLKYNKLL
ncbi:MAG: glycosyltransferase [Flavobacteriales bacterium]